MKENLALCFEFIQQVEEQDSRTSWNVTQEGPNNSKKQDTGSQE